MLQYRYRIIMYYVENIIKSILRIRKRYSNSSFSGFGLREHLDPTEIPQFKNQLTKPNIYYPMVIKTHGDTNKRNGKESYEQLYYIDICTFNHQILPVGFPRTTVIGCMGLVKASRRGSARYMRTFPGGIFEGRSKEAIHVKWRNKTNIPLMIELQGKESYKPDILYEKNNGRYKEAYHLYENDIDPAPYRYLSREYPWVLTGLYILKEERASKSNNSFSMYLPPRKYEYPLIIQDYSFYKDGSIICPIQRDNQSDEISSDYNYYGDTIIVNGKAWPNMYVERRQYRFYIINASISRTYNLSMSNGMDFIVIGGKMGLLASPENMNKLVLEPGEITDILIDFSRQAAGTKIDLINNIDTKYQGNEEQNPDTIGRIMRFTIPEHKTISIAPVKLPCD